MNKIKRTLLNSVVILVGGGVNFFVFLEAYKKLAFPYINEEQRVENAPYIVFYVLPIFIAIGIILFFAYKIVIGINAKNC